MYEIISSPKLLDETKEHYDVFGGEANLTNAAVDLLDTLAVEIEPELLMKHVVSEYEFETFCCNFSERIYYDKEKH